jgi:lactate dehydrogenase-like 2-hydroxyacid dehydrogenase
MSKGGRSLLQSVTNAPDALTECAADFSMLLVLAASRRASEYERIMRSRWGKSFGMTEMLGTRVNGKTLGIVGFGRIGRIGRTYRVCASSTTLEAAQEAQHEQGRDRNR